MIIQHSRSELFRQDAAIQVRRAFVDLDERLYPSAPRITPIALGIPARSPATFARPLVALKATSSTEDGRSVTQARAVILHNYLESEIDFLCG